MKLFFETVTLLVKISIKTKKNILSEHWGKDRHLPYAADVLLPVLGAEPQVAVQTSDGAVQQQEKGRGAFMLLCHSCNKKSPALRRAMNEISCCQTFSFMVSFLICNFLFSKK